jgi:hypothetical protein
VGATGVQLQPLVDALRDVVLGQKIIHADEAPAQMLTLGTKKIHRSYVWAYTTSQFSEWQQWFMTSVPAAPESMLATSCKTGGASWSAMILTVTRPASNSA